MVKYFCDGCGEELPEPYCLYTCGFVLCGLCIPKFYQKYSVGRTLRLPAPGTKLNLDESVRFTDELNQLGFNTV